MEEAEERGERRKAVGDAVVICGHLAHHLQVRRGGVLVLSVGVVRGVVVVGWGGGGGGVGRKRQCSHRWLTTLSPTAPHTAAREPLFLRFHTASLCLSCCCLCLHLPSLRSPPQRLHLPSLALIVACSPTTRPLHRIDEGRTPTAPTQRRAAAATLSAHPPPTISRTATGYLVSAHAQPCNAPTSSARCSRTHPASLPLPPLR